MSVSLPRTSITSSIHSEQRIARAKSILERNLNKTKGHEVRYSFAQACLALTCSLIFQVSLSAQTFLFSEMLQYAQKRVSGIQDLERKWVGACNRCYLAFLLSRWNDIDWMNSVIASAYGCSNYLHGEKEMQSEKQRFWAFCTLYTALYGKHYSGNKQILWKRAPKMKMNVRKIVYAENRRNTHT